VQNKNPQSPYFMRVFSFGGWGWIRTIEGKNRQIYSLMHLAALQPNHIKIDEISPLRFALV
jgi:hypothetical protein